MHPIKSIIARNQGRMSKNFDKCIYGKKLKQFKDIHKGETCFIIGNGPSLKIEDLTKIYELGIPSFAFNRIFCIFDETPWRPTYYVSQDINVTYGMEEQFKNLDLQYKFFPINWKWFDNIIVPGAFYFKTIDETPDIYNFSKDISKAIYNSATVAYTAFQIAYYMGFKRIYLIGTDQNYVIPKDRDFSGKNFDVLKQNYFSEKYLNRAKDDLKFPDVSNMNKAFISLNHHIKNGYIDVEAYNATRGGMLEVFERKDLDEVFRELESKK